MNILIIILTNKDRNLNFSKIIQTKILQYKVGLKLKEMWPNIKKLTVTLSKMKTIQYYLNFLSKFIFWTLALLIKIISNIYYNISINNLMKETGLWYTKLIHKNKTNFLVTLNLQIMMLFLISGIIYKWKKEVIIILMLEKMRMVSSTSQDQSKI